MKNYKFLFVFLILSALNLSGQIIIDSPTSGSKIRGSYKITWSGGMPPYTIQLFRDGVFKDIATNINENEYSFNTTNEPDGSVTIVVKDDRGNSGQVPVTIDNTPPDSDLRIVETRARPGQPINFTGTWRDISGISRIVSIVLYEGTGTDTSNYSPRVSIVPIPVIAENPDGNSGNYIGSYTLPTDLTPGRYISFRIEIEDQAVDQFGMHNRAFDWTPPIQIQQAGWVVRSATNLVTVNQAILPMSGATAVIRINLQANTYEVVNSVEVEIVPGLIRKIAVYNDDGNIPGNFDSGDTPIKEVQITNNSQRIVTIDDLNWIVPQNTPGYLYIVIFTSQLLDHGVQFQIRLNNVRDILNVNILPSVVTSNILTCEAEIVDLVPFRSDYYVDDPYINGYPAISCGRIDYRRYEYGEFYFYRSYYQNTDLFGIGANNFNIIDHPLLVPELMGICIPYRVLGLKLGGRSTYSDDDNEYLSQVTIVIEDTNIPNNFNPETDLAYYSNAPYPNISLWRDNGDGYFDPNRDTLIPIVNYVRTKHAPITKINPNDPNDRRWKATLQFNLNAPLNKTADDKIDFFVVLATEPSREDFTKRPFYGADFKVYIDSSVSGDTGIEIKRGVGRDEDQPKSTYMDQQTGEELPVPSYTIDRNFVKDVRIGLDIKPFERWNIIRDDEGRIVRIEKYPIDGPIEADGVPIPVFWINLTDGWTQGYGNNESLQWIRVWFKQTPEDPFKPTWLMPLSDDENSGVSLWLDRKDPNNPFIRTVNGGFYLWGLPDSRIITNNDMLLGNQRVSISDTLVPLDTSSFEWYNSDGTKWSPTNDDPKNPEGYKRYFVVLKPKTPIPLPDSDINPPPSPFSHPTPSNTGDYPGRQTNYGPDLFICIKPRGISVSETAYKSSDPLHRGIDFYKRIHIAIGLTENNDKHPDTEEPLIHLDNLKETLPEEVKEQPFRDILFGSGFLARIFPDNDNDGYFEPIETTTDYSTMPVFLSNLTNPNQYVNPYVKTPVIGINIVAPSDSSNYSFDSMTIMIVDENGTLDFDELVYQNADPNDPNGGCGIALYKDTNRNGIFDPLDKRVWMKKAPYLLPNSADDPLIGQRVYRVKMEFDNNRPETATHTPVGDLPKTDTGKDSGPEFFLVIQPNMNIDPGDRFYIVLWGSSLAFVPGYGEPVKEHTITFLKDGDRPVFNDDKEWKNWITFKRIRTNSLINIVLTTTVYNDLTPTEGLKVDATSSPVALIGLNIYDATNNPSQNRFIGARIYFDPLFVNLTPQKALAPMSNNITSGVSIWRDANGNGIFEPGTDSFLPMNTSNWLSDYIYGFVSGYYHTTIPAGTLLNPFDYSEKIYWADWDENGFWSDYDCLWIDNGDGFYRSNDDILLAGIAWEDYPGVLLHDYIFGFAFYSNYLQKTPTWLPNTQYKEGEYIKPKTPEIWKEKTSYSVGDKVIPTKFNGYYYRCISQGVSGGVEPDWLCVEKGKVYDGTVTWESIPLNMYIFRCIQGGTSGNIEPDWYPYVSEGQISDGEVIWKVERVKYLPEINKWSQGTYYKVGEIIEPTVRNNFVYRCIQEGTSGNEEPIWSTNIGDEISDGSVKWVVEPLLQNDIYFLGRGRNRLGYFVNLYLSQPVNLPTDDNNRGPDFFVVIRTGEDIEYLDKFTISIPSNGLIFSNGNSFANINITTNAIISKIPVYLSDIITPGQDQMLPNEKKPVISLMFYDSRVDIDNFLREINLYFTGTNPQGDIAPLSKTNTSGVQLYRDSNADGIWQETDEFISPSAIYWIGGERVRMIFENVKVPDTKGQYYFIVIQSSTTAGIGNILNVSIRSDISPISGDGIVFVREDGRIEKSSEYITTRQIQFTRPVLNVSQTNLDFGMVNTNINIQIRNTGGGILSWNFGTPTYYQGLNWLTVTPNSGTTSTEVDTVSIVVNRTGLSQGTYNAAIPLNSNGGNVIINVTMSVAGPKISVSTNYLDFGTTEVNKIVSIQNVGAGILHWSITQINYNQGNNWLVISPVSGETQTEVDTISVSVNRAGLNPGTYSATFVIDSDGGTEIISVVMEVLGPKLDVSPLMLNFGETLSTVSFTVLNIGAGTLLWRIKDIIYEQQVTPWITNIQPNQGSVTVNNPATVFVSVNRANLTPGTYGCRIIVEGNGDFKEVLVSITVSIPLRFRISAGAFHSLAIKDNGTLWAWGRNDSGQLGDGTTTDRTSPVQITSYSDWIKVSAGYAHSAGIRSDGSLWTWGKNNFGQLGDGTTIDRNEPVRIGNDNDWVDVACGSFFTLAIKSDGTLWAWGRNDYGQLGDGTRIDKLVPTKIGFSRGWVSISAGWNHSLGLKSDGSLWAWGNNDFGQLGTGNKTTITSPVMVGSDRNWTSVKAGWNHSIGIKNDGSLWVWGCNYSGQIGDGTTIDRTTPIMISGNWINAGGGSSYTLAVKYDGTLWGWGSNFTGQLGDGTTVDKYIPNQIGTDNKWLGVVCGASHTLAVKKDGTLWAWGSNGYGQLGNGNTSSTFTPIQIGTGFVMTKSGGNYFVALKEDGSLWAAGSNEYGQLGIGNNNSVSELVKIGDNWKFVSCGYSHTVGIKEDGSLWAWGNNDNGQLGINNYKNSYSPTKVGSDNDWKFVSCGYSHTVGIKEDGSLWAWGNNDNGQLGIGNIVTNIPYPFRVGSDDDWKFVSCGYSHTVGIKEDGSLWAWGNNDNGQLGIGNYQNVYLPVRIGYDNDWKFVSCGYSHTIGIKKDGSLWAWGSNWFGQLGTGDTVSYPYPVRIGKENTWEYAIAGYSFTIALKKDGSLWAWGSNWNGVFGLGNTRDSLIPIRIPLSEELISISSGYTHTIGLSRNKNIYLIGGDNNNIINKTVVGGDLNNDGFIDILDVVLCLRISIGLNDGFLGDVNWDGIIDISDVILILRASIGL